MLKTSLYFFIITAERDGTSITTHGRGGLFVEMRYGSRDAFHRIEGIVLLEGQLNRLMHSAALVNGDDQFDDAAAVLALDGYIVIVFNGGQHVFDLHVMTDIGNLRQDVGTGSDERGNTPDTGTVSPLWYSTLMLIVKLQYECGNSLWK